MERDQSRDQDVGGNIKMDLIEIECNDLDWFDVAQKRDKWRAFVNAVMDLQVP
jgi:hypothetical protein